ncbi:MAG: aldolase [Rhodospirillaceae bacterium]|nr:aldolase [Rhodospirillaceae bacterium]|tara:strand:+ start:299 stop:625 length:327 start_codon:yes stop_codon:yes gene_type:complete
MADGFKDREKGYEAKYQHDQEMLFKITARRNKLLGLWAAEIMGLSDDAAEEYSKEVVASDFEEAGDADVVRKLLGDLNDKGSPIDESELRKQMDILGDTARQQIEDEA